MRGSYEPGTRRPAFDASQGIAKGLERVGQDSTRRVPVGEGFAGAGDLRDSLRIVVEGNSGTIAYLDQGAVGAHERLDQRPANGKERKYLESALAAQRQALLAAIADDLRGEFR